MRLRSVNSASIFALTAEPFKVFRRMLRLRLGSAGGTTICILTESEHRGCGVAVVVAEDGVQVWGVVYEIADIDIRQLDTKEGYKPGRDKNAYCRRECLVFLEGDEERPLTVCTYFACRQPNPPLPNAGYKDLIVTGARYWHLPEEYVRELKTIEVDG